MSDAADTAEPAPQRPDRSRFLSECLEYRRFLASETRRNEELIASLGGDAEQGTAPPEPLPRPHKLPRRRRTKAIPAARGAREKIRRAAVIDRVLRDHGDWMTVGELIAAARPLDGSISEDRRLADAAIRTVLKRSAGAHGWMSELRSGQRYWRKKGGPT